MKVKIGPYVNWFGPYQLAEKLMFWVPMEKDEYGFPQKPKKVHQFGEWLAHGSIRPEPKIGERRKLGGDDRPITKLYRFLNWIHSKKKRKVYVHIDRWDTWSMDETLAFIIHPMLLKLRDEKHGSPSVDDEDVPDHLKSTAAPELTQEQKDCGHTDDNHHERWDWVLNEMIFAFESKLNPDWEYQFTKGEYDYDFEVIDENGTSQLVEGSEHTAVTDWDAKRAYGKRIENGFRLFGKYYQGLWD